MKHNLIFLLSIFILFGTAKAQTNLQEQYDFGRGQFTTTLEMFKSDNWGSNFFFVDIYHTPNFAPTEFYSEISRSLNFWQNTWMKDFSLHAEWNGGCGIYDTENGWGGYGINNAWLFGGEYLFHTMDYRYTFTLQVLYKNIRGGHSDVPMQFTAVWGCNDLFGVRGLNFSGFADFWWEDVEFPNPEYTNLPPWQQLLAIYLGYPAQTMTTHCVFLSEPQLWYNVGQHFGCDNLSIGGEVEISHNFTGAASTSRWVFNPAAGIKWVF